MTFAPAAPAPLVYQALKASSGVATLLPWSTPQRDGQFHSAAGCSFATVWQCAMQEGAKAPRLSPGAASPAELWPGRTAASYTTTDTTT